MTAVQCMEHAWMKARKQQTNLNSSTSSLDSALCMDSASSMEPSPVSSASSSFSPAPSMTTRSTSSTVSTSSSSLSQPEDMKKVNDKLISTLATERLIAADSANKMRGEGSPTSTNSSTSTLKGDESAENIPGLIQEQTVPKRDVSVNKEDTSVTKEALSKKDSTDSAVVSCHSHSFEGPLIVTRSSYRKEPLLSDPDKSPSVERRSKTPLSYFSGTMDSKDYLSRSCTLDRKRETPLTGTKSVDREATYTTSSGTLGRSSRGLSRQKAEDLLALDPKTIQSLEKLKKLTAHKRPTTPEPLAPPVSDVKLLHSPERRRRRKSEGMHPIEKQVSKNFKPIENTLHEGDECDDEREMDEEVTKKDVPASVSKSMESKMAEDKKKDSFKNSVGNDVTPARSTHSVESKINCKEKNEESSVKRVSSPSNTSVIDSKRVTSAVNSSRKNEVLDSVTVPSSEKEPCRSVSPQPSEIEGKIPTPGSSSRLTNSNGDRSPSPKKRISSNTSSEEVKPGPVSISSFTRNTPVDRMWSDFKKEDDNSNNMRTSPRSSRYQQSPNSSNNEGSPNHYRRRYVTREKFLDDGRSSFKLKPSPQRSAETSPQTSRSSSPTKALQRDGTKTSPETVTTSSPSSEKVRELSPMRNRSMPPIPSTNGDDKKPALRAEEGKCDSKPEAPAISVQPPSTSETKGQSISTSPNSGDSLLQIRSSRDVRVRQKSSNSDCIKVIKANRRKTPVISEDALAAILRGDISDEELSNEPGMCPLSPSQAGDRRMTLETCPEEEEGPADAKRFTSPSRKNILKQPSVKQAPSPHRSPEKKVTINSEPRVVRRSGKRPMLSAEMRERTKSLTSFSPERSVSPTSPDFSTIPEEGGSLSKSINFLSMPVGRLRASTLVHSQSTPDLSEILGPRKKDHKARRIERSFSKRRVRVDSYVTSTTPNSTFNPIQPSGTFTGPRSSSRRLSGSGSRLSKLFSRKEKEDKNLNNKQTEKSSKRW